VVEEFTTTQTTSHGSEQDSALFHRKWHIKHGTQGTKVETKEQSGNEGAKHLVVSLALWRHNGDHYYQLVVPQVVRMMVPSIETSFVYSCVTIAKSM
jgi:hypothetical protein